MAHNNLADEPTEDSDPRLSAAIMNLFQEFNNVGVTVLVVRMRHRVLTLRQERMVNDAGVWPNVTEIVSSWRHTTIR